MCEEAIPLLDTATHDDMGVLEDTACATGDNYAVSDDIFRLNENDDIQKVLLQTKKHRTELSARGPILPEGKEAHIFISYSSIDRNEVCRIVADLERIGLGCILDDRDFYYGRKILTNIEHGMEKSSKVLLFLSNNFIKSAYCMEELDLAFQMSKENAENIVIPVLLEECDLPRRLQMRRYIDATNEKQTLPHRILEAFNNPDDVNPLHICQEKRKLENGFCVEVQCRRDTLCWCRPVEKTFEIDETVIKEIRESRIKVSMELLQEAVNLINEHNKKHFWKKVDIWCFPCGLCIFTYVLFTTVAVAVFFLAFLQVADMKLPSQGAVDITKSFNNVYWVILLAVVVYVCTCGLKYKFGGQASRKLDEKLFDRITTFSYKDNVLFSIRDDDTPNPDIYLRIIRYNVKPCETYLAERIRKNAYRRNHELSIHANAEAEANAIILPYLRRFLVSAYHGNEKFLPDAPEIRHNVKGGKKCFCQILEDKVPLTKPDDVIVV